ncbi:MAG: T9SS type A sorting domain-containing protein [Bacteroidia bacterium]|nr:T9SS type A sorting domain-containing protein [Bacteroidia bacterium]
MKKKIRLFVFFLILQTVAFSQISNNIFGIARDPNTLYLATINPGTGVSTHIGSQSIGNILSIGGAALNPYSNTYHYFGFNTIESVDIATGNLVSSVQTSNPLGQSYFDFPQFNNSDSIIYGLSRRYYYDSVLMTNVGEVHLASIDPVSGLISQISGNSVGNGILMNSGSVLDPYQMVYYYSTGATLMGLDIYNGAIYSNPTLTFTKGNFFANMVFNCSDSLIYGLIQYNHYDYVYSPIDSSIISQTLNLDSCALWLGTVNPSTGVVTRISASSVGISYSLNASATINPNTQVYYFQSEAGLTGVDIVTGNVLTQQTVSNANGSLYFDLMRHYQNCYGAVETRFPEASTNISNQNFPQSFEIYPNPGETKIKLSSSSEIELVEFMDITGRIVSRHSLHLNTAEINVSSLPKGVYIVKAYAKEGGLGFAKWVKN